ncbi:hypothetical protein MTR_5g035755 [Medicago truncatula]|uniref:Uncharacterized protein n=1 Tax=Medicago truncatula TaxID=3880 RepID=A0A072UDS2_MEDTR|nr:hypothetical protein MTR_5g035755 [Medicago truncatula]
MGVLRTPSGTAASVKQFLKAWKWCFKLPKLFKCYIASASMNITPSLLQSTMSLPPESASG